ncbi:hypothetical protein [Nonomuraea sp. WAC 01424]|uniref:hypothetical protein n=1 Tax=Nonomuraea sp. WAC 01424 TaxID=2203200 RepID=UPI000F7AE4DF|nr:hypothetical protein [Nonomuraea sp. WAC 01424]
MDASLEIVKVKRQLRRMRVGLIAAAVLTGAVLAGNGEAVAQGGGKATFDEIEVQRINVVEPDGKPRMVLSNKDRSPGAVVNGVDLGNAGTRPGMTFYNGEGDEAGGLGTDNGVNGGKPWAVGQLSFDQYKQDQTLVLRYMEQEGVRGVGLAVDDRPETPLPESFEEYRKIEQMPPGPERDQAMAAYRKKYPSPQRVFIGKNPDKSSAVTLADGKGAPRIVMRVDQDGNPRIQFLNAAGKVTRTIKG